MRMNRQKRLQQILDSSLRAFARDGYENTSVSGLVKEAQVSRGTFYLYFNSKKEIFDALIDRFMSEIVHHVSLFDAVHLKDIDGFASNLSLCLSKYSLLAHVMMFHARGIEKSHNEKIDAYIKQCYKILQYNIDDAVRKGRFNHVDSAMMARSMVGSVKEFILEWSRDNESFNLTDRLTSYLNFIKSSLVALDAKSFDSEHIETTDRSAYRDLEQPKSNFYSS